MSLKLGEQLKKSQKLEKVQKGRGIGAENKKLHNSQGRLFGNFQIPVFPQFQKVHNMLDVQKTFIVSYGTVTKMISPYLRDFLLK